jgi:hypothetical protein
MPLDVDRFVVERDRYLTCERAISEQIDALEDGTSVRPDFMIIGAPRSGTTFLFSLLNSLPDVYIPVEKELKFFSANLVMCDLESYLGHFKRGAGKLCGEGSPSYASLPTSRIELIRKLNPDLKIIYLLREPRLRLASDWKQVSRDLGSWSEHDLVSYVASDGPVAACDYAGNLERWLQFFPASQIKVCFFEEFSLDPRTVFEDVAQFLGAEPHAVRRKKLLQRHNETWNDPDVQKSVDRVAPYLLSARTAKLKPLLQERFPGMRLPEWAQSVPEPSGPPVIALFDLSPGTTVGATVLGDYLCGPRPAIEALARDQSVSYDRIRAAGLGMGRYLAEAIGHRLIIESLGEKRLYAACHGDQWDGDLFIVRDSYFGWNILFYRKLFYAVRIGAGPVDLRTISADRLRDLVRRGEVREFERLEDALEYAASLWRFLSLIDA